MKKIPLTYTFDSSAKTITCSQFTNIELIALITNLTTGTIIYQFNLASKGGTLSGTVLTLNYDTTSMADTDELQIILHQTSPSVKVMSDQITFGDNAMVSMAVLHGYDTISSTFKDVQVNSHGDLKVQAEAYNTSDIRINPSTEDRQVELMEIIREQQNMIMEYIQMSQLVIPRNADTTNNSDRVTVVNTVPTTISSGTITNLQQLNGYQSHQMSFSTEIQTAQILYDSIIL